jgi:tRNA nucleotidyltransferase/poly(A) polymerase
MSDYMFMLESHLSGGQSLVVGQIQAAAAEANVNLFLTGGALRDMIAGFPISEIEFTVEGNALKLAKAVAAKTGAEILQLDENRKVAQLKFPEDVRATIGMARVEKYPKPGSKPQVQTATIHDDLRNRDFTINAIALSLNAASRGLLLDPNNGVGDMARRELRTVTNYSLYDDPIRMLRLQRLKVRLGFSVVERTQAQYINAREAELEARIPAPALLEELRRIANEPNIGDLIRVLDEEKLLPLFSPTLSGAKVNLAGMQKLQKAKQLLPYGMDSRSESLGLFLNILLEKLAPAEKTAFLEGLELGAAEIENLNKLDARARKLEKDLKSPTLSKPSQLYQLVSKAPSELILYLLVKSPERLVQDRLRNYLQKYLPAAQEITDADVLATGVQPDTPKFAKARNDLITARLDARPRRVPPPEAVPTEATPAPAEAIAARK